ncbi:MAG: serine acetyltransferase [Planctomycetaceae bacterium]
MRFRETHASDIDQIVRELLSEMTDRGCSLHENALPSVEGVIAIAADVRDLLLPGYRSTRSPLATDRSVEFTSLMHRVNSRLRIEVGRAILHHGGARLKIHDGGDADDSALRCPTELTAAFLKRLPNLRRMLLEDVQAAFDGDPAAKTPDEIILCYPGIEAVMIHRVAHELLLLGIPYLPRILSEWAHRETGIDIHPGASIGPRFFIDHGTGVVIGETCVIGSGVTLYQGVTLGAWSFPRDEDGNLIRGTKRHPTLEDNVTVYSNATVLGGSTVIGAGSQIGSNVTLSRTIPPNTIVTIEPPSLRFREAG